MKGLNGRAVSACFATFLLATVAQAQNALLPLDDLAYTYIDALQSRGQFRELSVIERPYTVGAVRAAIGQARGRLHDAGSLRWLHAIDAAAD